MNASDAWHGGSLGMYKGGERMVVTGGDGTLISATKRQAGQRVGCYLDSLRLGAESVSKSERRLNRELEAKR